MIALKALAIWAGILLLAAINGGLREAILMPKIGAATGLVLSGILLSILIFATVYLSLPWLGACCSADLVGIGLGWISLTLVFEFSFGLWQGKSWQIMLEA